MFQVPDVPYFSGSDCSNGRRAVGAVADIGASGETAFAPPLIRVSLAAFGPLAP